MNKQNKKYGASLLKIAVVAFFFTGIFANCARVGAISGGPKDTLAPIVLKMTPAERTRNFTGRSIFIEFDEYVQLKDLQKEFYTSPGMKKKPAVTIKGRGIRIDLQDTLLPNTTYAMNFASSIVDNNESNPLNDFRYVFSTGDEIDSMVMSGYTANAFKGDSVSKTFVYFFDSTLDSIPDYDSVVFNNIPEAIGRAANNGIFITENLKPKAYRIYAVQDENNNGQYDAGNDMIGFLDSVYNPGVMPDFNAWYDTTRKYIVADPQLYFRMFKDERPARQALVSSIRPRQHQIILVFSSPYPEIERLTFENIDTTKIVRQYLKSTQDSIALWLDIPGDQLPDTVKGEIVYLRHDSINQLVSYTQKLNLSWRKIESREQERERLKLEKNREKAIQRGEQSIKEENPFKFAISGSSVNPERHIIISFDYPLVFIDSLAITLSEGDSLSRKDVPAKFIQDTADMRKWRIEADWTPAQKYKLFIPSGSLQNIAGHRNDSIIRSYETMDPEKTGTLIVNVTGITPDSEYILQLVSENGKLQDEIRHAKTGSYTFRYIPAGNIQIMVVEDMNSNGIWDTGNLVHRRQPERVDTYMESPGDPNIPIKNGWLETRNLDMNELFSPITMQKIRERLEREDAIRLVKILEEIEKRKKQPQQNQQQKGSVMDVMQGSGIALPGMR